MATREEFAKQAADECNSAKTSAHHGGDVGRPFWNAQANQFMFVPSFLFQPIPGYKRYLYTAKDEKGGIHTFEADNSFAVLEPIWKDIPEGVVSLTVHALDENGNEKYLVGARTFFKLASFPADAPAAARDYKEASLKAFDYAMSQSFILHWLNEGTPDPDYNLNVYPSKIISAIIGGMIHYADICPQKADDAIKIAKNAADYLMGITAKSGAMEGIPPTYQIDFRDHPETRKNLTAADRIETVMMIYPATVGRAYLQLEAKTKDKKYLDAALKIAAHFRDNVEENGSWYLIRNIKTGEALTDEYCDPLEVIVPFMMELYERVGDPVWKKLADGAINYIEKTSLLTYEWGAQFEDSFPSINYSNLTHYGAVALVNYYAKYFSNDEKRMAIAEDLIRFVEDQFVVWKRPAPWNKNNWDTSSWHTPCGLEQYAWYLPIDSSTASILESFMEMHKAGRGELYLEKAKALANSITIVQHENGMIPTHWLEEEGLKGSEFWINCMFYSATVLAKLADYCDK